LLRFAAGRELFRQIELARRLRTKAVIHAVGDHGQTEAFADGGHHVEQRRRVTAAAHGEENPLSFFEPALFLQRPERQSDERRRMRPRHVSTRSS
jgi:hypothetical protein